MLLVPLLQDTPNTASFLYIGFSIVIGLLVLYLASFEVRRRSLQKDLDLVESLEAEARERAASKPPAR